jgi:hypothetical protein
MSAVLATLYSLAPPHQTAFSFLGSWVGECIPILVVLWLVMDQQQYFGRNTTYWSGNGMSKQILL